MYVFSSIWTLAVSPDVLRSSTLVAVSSPSPLVSVFRLHEKEPVFLEETSDSRDETEKEQYDPETSC